MRRILEITSPARLSVRHRQLVIARPEAPPAQVPLEDIGMVIVDHPAASYSQAVFTGLAAHGGALVLCGPRHQPAGTFLPLAGHALTTERQALQLTVAKPLKKRLWKAVVQAKIRQQGRVLEHLTLRDAGLLELAKRVRSGDPDNLEAQAAQRYWPALFGRDFRRRRDGPPPNHLLNYGYAVLRAAMARALVGGGLLPTVGIHHHRRDNPFCLADDLMEPFRPFVDLRVARLAPAGGWPEDLDRDAKAAVLGAFTEWVPLGGLYRPLSLALHHSVSGLVNSFAARRDALVLPGGLPREEGDVPDDQKGTGDEDGDEPVFLAHDVGAGAL